MVSFSVGVAAGFLLCLAGLAFFAHRWQHDLEASTAAARKLIEADYARMAEESIAAEWENYEPQATEIVREQAELHREAIELGALKRLVEATNKSMRTGRPVKVTFAGVDDVIYVTPPPSTPINPHAVN